MTASKETVVEKVKEIKDLCNVSSIASDLKLSVNAVKRFFPLDDVCSVTTGECDGSFVVHLRRPNSTEDQKQLIPSPSSIWSSHGYQKLPQDQLSVAERNSRYLSLLNDRPSPLISSDTAPRKLGQNSAAPDFKTEKKASSAEFFGNKTASTNGTASKKSPIKKEPPSLFQKKTKAEDSKATKNIKKETPSPDKAKADKSDPKHSDKQKKENVKKEQVKSEAIDCDAVKSEPVKNTKTSKAEVAKTTKSLENESSKKKKTGSPKATVVEKASKAKKETPAKDSARESVQENKRKRDEDASDDEEVVRSSRGKKRQLKRVAILDSDSDNENGDNENEEANEGATENVDEDCMDTSESPVKTTKKSKKKTEKATSDQKTNGTSSKKNSKNTSPLKAFTKKETEKNTASDSEKTSNAQNDKPNGQQQKRRRRVLKEVTHTFKGEDGFLETKTVKEMVSETDSESEEAAAPKNKATTKSVSVATTPAPRGQASLLTFFKKK